MMKAKYHIAVLGVSMLLGLTSCNDFLSTLPDNRAEVSSYEDIRSLLITAYPTQSYVLIGELSSDNVIHNMEGDSYTTRIYDQLYDWADVTEGGNDAPKRLWETAYRSIQTANVALERIEQAGNDERMKALRGEALLCRAFGHYLVVSIFAEAYDPATADSKMGVPYITRPETTLNPKYERGTLSADYEQIAKDIEEGLPLISDQIYSAPKYHFNQKAAYAFAARFNLFYQKWDKAKEYADLALGSDASRVLRDYTPIEALPSGGDGFKNRCLKWLDYNSINNLLLINDFSSTGRYYGFYRVGCRATHSSFLSNRETLDAPKAWGSTAPQAGWLDSVGRKISIASLVTPYNKYMLPKNPVLFEIRDRLAGTGYLHSASAEFTTDETLLVRAEANIMLGNTEAALADMNTYIFNFYRYDDVRATNPDYRPLTDDKVKAWNQQIAYSTPTALTPRKQLNPSWTITKDQEDYLQVLLHLRRIETLQTGLRFLDIKRYGIEVTRIDVANNAVGTPTANVLTKDDPRRALQIPEEAISAGMIPNRQRQAN